MEDHRRADVVIVGGAAMGASIAYFIKAVIGSDLGVIVIERDPVSAVPPPPCRQLPSANNSPPRRISAYRASCFAFLRDLSRRYGPRGDPGLREGGYLILASVAGLSALGEDVALQRAEGAAVALLDRVELAARFPWLALGGLGGGALGLASEGWFDAHALLATLRREAERAGAVLLTGEVVAVDIADGRVAGVRLADGRAIGCGLLVNAAGTAAGRLAALAGRSLPVEPRKRTVFVVDCPDAPSSMPLLADPSGFWIRPEGALFLAGYSPPAEEDGPADPEDFAPDLPLFEEVLWPLLARRVPAFETLKPVRAWAGHYDTNAFDHNAIIGPDPELPNLIYANGLSGHGLQHAPGVGRALAEWIAFGEYRSLDLAAFGYERIAAGRPLRERAVI